MNIVIVGAGAAGLMAAATAAAACREQPGESRVVVLEKNRKAGVKILMSGGTRCNITHDCGPAGIMEAFGRGGSFLRQALAILPPAAVVELFNSLGVATQVESTGKVFPSSNRSLDVRDALLRYTIEAGAEVKLGVTVKSIERDGERFLVRMDDGDMSADRVIVTSGGRSYPGCGTIGEGYGWMKSFGHSIVQTRPALVPLVGGEAWMHEISGVTLEHVCVNVWSVPEPGRKAEKRPLLSRPGGFLFTHLGYSGPTAMDVSGVITEAGDPTKTRLTLDLIPDKSAAEVESWFENSRQRDGRRKVVAAMMDWIPRRLAEAISLDAGAADSSFAELSRVALTKLSNHLKRLPLPVTGTRGFEKAEVTGGGVSLREVDPRTMQSRLVPGLFIAGEILDLDGWIGGYNFQSAFSTGYVAGQHAAKCSG